MKRSPVLNPNAARLPDGSIDVAFYRKKYPALQRVVDGVNKVKRSFVYKGETCTVKRLSEIAGVSASVIYQRIKMGWTIEQTVTGDKPHGMKGRRNAGKTRG